VLTGFMTGWLTPSRSVRVFALGLFAFLAATYLTLDTRDEPDLQEDFAWRSLWSGLALVAPIAWWSSSLPTSAPRCIMN